MRTILDKEMYIPFIITEMNLGEQAGNKSNIHSSSNTNTSSNSNSNWNSPRKYLKMDHATDSVRDSLNFMHSEKDLLNGKQMANLYISTYSAQCEWHHDFGLFSSIMFICKLN